MRIAALVLAALSGPAPAQDVEGEIVDLLRARDCSMGAAALSDVLTVMGRPPGRSTTRSGSYRIGSSTGCC